MTAPLREHALRTPDADSSVRRSLPLAPVVQRKCGCGGSCGSCSEEKKKKVQRRALGDTGREVPESVGSILGSAGRPLDDETRMSMESRFGRSFADVRVHTDTHAAESARDISAAAYTSGTHIVFGAGRFAPQTPAGRRLLAHELAHVVQQRSGTALPGGIGPADDAHEQAADRAADAVVAQGPAFVPPPVLAPAVEGVVRRKREEGETPAEEEARRLIVEDSASPAPGQMRRKEFVAELDAVICETSREEMGRLGQSTEGCPLLDQWRPRIRKMDARQLEVSMRRWVDGEANVRTAGDYIPAVATRLARSIRIWGATGQVVGVPPDLMDLLGGGKIRVGVGSLIRGAVGSLFRKARDGAPAPSGGVALDAGAGRPLDTGVASRMGHAFGRDFSDVRIHTDAEAGAAAAQANARAFTIGNDIAFAGGEYAPGTIVGDALLAHELAHVAQQDGADGGVLTKSDEAGSALEHDADNAAVHAVASLWPSVGRFARGLRTNAMPRLKSSLKLQRCSASASELQQYLGKLDSTKQIENAGDSDNKARQIVEAWSGGDTQYILTIRRKKLLLEEMLSGDVSGSDQEQILNLLERSFAPELEQMIGPKGVPHARLLDEFGRWETELWRFYMRRYPGAYDEKTTELLDTGKAPEPVAPDRKKLDATQPNEEHYSVVQPGDKLPETTQAKEVKSGRDPKARLTKEQAAAWIGQTYGTYVAKDRAAKVDAARVQTHSDPDFNAVVDDCVKRMDAKPEADKSDEEKKMSFNDKWQRCTIQHKSTAGFWDEPTGKLHVHSGREAPSTMVHEVMHAFANPAAVEKLSWLGKEGLTEYLTRQVILRHQYAPGEQPLYVGGFYTQAHDAIQELAILVGENLLAGIHFRGEVTPLCNALGKAKFDAWVAEMAKEDAPAATKILRGETAVKESKEKCQ